MSEKFNLENFLKKANKGTEINTLTRFNDNDNSNQINIKLNIHTS